MKRMILISAAAALLAATASPAMADHSRVAVSVSYGPTLVRYANSDWYYNGYRYVRYNHRYDRSYDRKHDRRHDRRYFSRNDDRRTWYAASSKSKKKSKQSKKHRRHNDWCPIERGHWH